VASAAFRALRWFVHEFVVSVQPVATSKPGSLCRLVGCAVIVAVLRVELGNGLLPSPTAAVIQFGVACLTAILLGNIAKEIAFEICARFVTWSGRSFVRNGLTPGGNTYCEIQFTDGTWMRCEMGSAGTFYEWTEPDGRCNRIELLDGMSRPRSRSPR
jgi:hypothetical protein